MKDTGSSSTEGHERIDWRAALADLGVTPSKARGQNFLHDRRIVERIVDVAQVGAGDTVLEIGPGLGVMTLELAQRARRVIAVEVDARLAERLRVLMPANVTVIHEDALNIDFGALAGPDYHVVANLPYSIGTALIRRCQESDPPPQSLTVMVQREVAERMCAAPPAMSLLAVGVQFYGRPVIQFRVGGGAFIPPPRVESAVVRIETGQPPLPRAMWPAFFRIVSAGFASKRKQLLNTLSAGLGIGREAALHALQRAEIDPTLRAETLNVGDWVTLFRALDGDTP